ncbi:flagellar biosynthesis anti-sigma factor FlgM [Verticiella sediminum]|uniref:Negative regulator of flagellin synthesis n=1 Tax=Verticiella sediminum TaxID=1247510 RepID=A0A556ARV5_9BURK|nr:flagellar biosynthesis anti-sigma factor FlgM [Verticiella sediminum]TSH95684.1 flagellar biosynthesis anti-sigma factor FlgM [Verticiella sediminum]
MKIAPVSAPAAEAPDAANTLRRKPAAADTAAAGATVALSATSTALAQADGDIDMARVETIRQAIRAGELTIDPARIADGLIESVRELIR